MEILTSTNVTEFCVFRVGPCSVCSLCMCTRPNMKHVGDTLSCTKMLSCETTVSQLATVQHTDARRKTAPFEMLDGRTKSRTECCKLCFKLLLQQTDFTTPHSQTTSVNQR